MTLELKHLVGYLPYKLKVASGDWYDEDCKLDRISTMVMSYDNYTPNNISINQLCGNIDGKFKIDGVIRRKAKPILRPLSDLTKEIDGVVHLVELAKIHMTSSKWTLRSGKAALEHDFFTFVYDDGFRAEFVYDICDVNNQLSLYGYLFQHHFDVYELIEKGLAIDINKIENEQI